MVPAIIFFMILTGIIGQKEHDNYKDCKAEEFKPNVCEKYKSLRPPSERK
jgi:hypothetical protein